VRQRQPPFPAHSRTLADLREKPSFPASLRFCAFALKYFRVLRVFRGFNCFYGRNKSADILTKPAGTGGAKEQLELGGC
jgi:hypothetical protein